MRQELREIQVFKQSTDSEQFAERVYADVLTREDGESMTLDLAAEFAARRTVRQRLVRRGRAAALWGCSAPSAAGVWLGVGAADRAVAGDQSHPYGKPSAILCWHRRGRASRGDPAAALGASRHASAALRPLAGRRSALFVAAWEIVDGQDRPLAAAVLPVAAGLLEVTPTTGRGSATALAFGAAAGHGLSLRRRRRLRHRRRDRLVASGGYWVHPLLRLDRPAAGDGLAAARLLHLPDER